MIQSRALSGSDKYVIGLDHYHGKSMSKFLGGHLIRFNTTLVAILAANEPTEDTGHIVIGGMHGLCNRLQRLKR
jgi:hypothetical protein